ncbi:MAG: hypothetical protein EP301_04250 [Gammaproteobacteria bacterium]|nr:MAG: hypothetical protein EP301_04250 [Gammaproteobacteria bacterium]
MIAPGGEHLLVSQMGQMDGSEVGDLVLYRPGDGPGGEIQRLFPQTRVVDERSWGDRSCSPPDMNLFSPHGIDLVRRENGDWMLLVVNHGARESVELFQVMGEGDSVALRWRGCALGPERAAFNDVVGLRNGGFYVTHMYPLDGQILALLKNLVFGSDTGHVYEWSQGEGWAVVPGSNGPFPNGIALAADERSLFVNMYLAGEVRKLDLATGTVVASYKGGQPDNSTWDSTGRLLVATHTADLSDLTACTGLTEGSCGFAFRIVALDPEDLSAKTVLEHSGPPMGGATVALEMDGHLYLGTFAGDRIARLRFQGAE